MSKKIEVKVNMHDQKCKTKVLKAVTKLTGINEVSVDLAKQMVVVIGDVDPVCVVCRIRKIDKTAKIMLVLPWSMDILNHMEVEVASFSKMKYEVPLIDYFSMENIKKVVCIPGLISIV
ncbi:heavy metal-associated isoprenylated plant protein 43-like [Cynara cardunculus var. scolymus]|uniref:heavy metal-associated isoprenylated plant protein 43-like n=1 Tax=Cynara cardunculus var. scolymus TaxID=59895 RepID=UPI000D62B842|nr:heavy metal-associated isoprenylated plant protein 43-like [Cynara cardunculus var. scolymus]